MIRAAALLVLALVVAGCDSAAPRRSDPTEPTEPGIHVTGEARIGVVWGD
ncbi:hypothetical protein [Phaeobacter sp. HF9A]|nr:hypothetical protein [Phaeobacter sp. HF9A]NIZ12488.1 hypothetical protein [Phaeobacter sp. HF9A]